jgi:hypothetical protein
MDAKELAILRQKLEDKKQRADAAAELEYREGIRALEVVWRLAQESSNGNGNGARLEPEHVAPPREAPSPPSATSNAHPRLQLPAPSLTALVRDAISAMPPDKFTMRDIASYIERHNPHLGFKRVFISSALNKLRNQGTIIQTCAGSGKAPAVYKKKEWRTT